MIKNILLSMRPRQWLKNLFIFAALIFSRQYVHGEKVLLALAAFCVFSLLSSAVYIINDIIDLPKDRKHALKRNRPIASGRLSPASAGWFAGISAGLALGAAWLINPGLAGVALGYFILMLAYLLALKHVVILDTMVIAVGFILRVVAGGLVIGVAISAWLYLCTFLLAVFLALNKRRHELIIMEENASEHRKVLADYSPYLLDQMIVIVAAATLMAYSVYTIHEQTVRMVSDKLYFTLPFVIYGIFRYLYLVHQKSEGGAPEEALLGDPALLIDVLLWAISVFIILQLS